MLLDLERIAVRLSCKLPPGSLQRFVVVTRIVVGLLCSLCVGFRCRDGVEGVVSW